MVSDDFREDIVATGRERKNYRGLDLLRIRVSPRSLRNTDRVPYCYYVLVLVHRLDRLGP